MGTAAISQIVGDRKAEWNSDTPKRLNLYVLTEGVWRYVGNVTNFDWQAQAPDYAQVNAFSTDVLYEDQHWI